MVGSPDRGGSDLGALRNHSALSSSSQLEHLLRVAASITQDANGAWAELWAVFKPHVTASGVVGAELEKGFVPECGWAEFLEKLWLLKHYLDSIDRICKDKHCVP